MSDVFSIPDELELLEFFSAEPVERSVEDGYWCYEVSDRRGVRLRFSFNLFERSVQTALQVMDLPLITVSHEGAESMTVSGKTMTCRFSYQGSDARLVLRLNDSINLDWLSLRKY
ncbi:MULTISPECIES: hypothetical protein [Corallococcus]|uniref:hypothetical protein n=1 Tax=Corallococcus TaxID=83461 RepID=UPI0011C48A17|nr:MULTISPECIES: hypothetical protein [Corallococcus]NPD26988.1 hypothetical protein [Corallococcus exiguus]